MTPIPHGTNGGYTNHACRCSLCVEAHRETIAKRRAERYAYVAANGLPVGVPHGRNTYHNWGCRCDVCTAASSAESRRRREARP